MLGRRRLIGGDEKEEEVEDEGEKMRRMKRRLTHHGAPCVTAVCRGAACRAPSRAPGWGRSAPSGHQVLEGTNTGFSMKQILYLPCITQILYLHFNIIV